MIARIVWTNYTYVYIYIIIGIDPQILDIPRVFHPSCSHKVNTAAGPSLRTMLPGHYGAINALTFHRAGQLKNIQNWAAGVNFSEINVG